MTAGQIILLVGAIVVGDVILVGVVIYGVSAGLRSFSARWPAREPGAGAVRREFQSFKIGIVGLGWSVHVAVDEDHLHLSPAWLARRVGMRAMSIPWEAVTPGRSLLGGREVEVDGMVIRGPRWCLELAERSSASRG